MPSPPRIYTPSPYVKAGACLARGSPPPRSNSRPGAPLPSGCYNAGVTLVEITYELQSPLEPEQLRALGGFANTYGLRGFRVDEQGKRLTLEYDASRLRETEVAHVLQQARIPVVRRVDS